MHCFRWTTLYVTLLSPTNINYDRNVHDTIFNTLFYLLQLSLITTLVVTAQVIDSVPLGVTVGLSPRYHPIDSLYHVQDNYGQYVYGYATPTISKSETKTADGVTRVSRIALEGD